MSRQLLDSCKNDKECGENICVEAICTDKQSNRGKLALYEKNRDEGINSELTDRKIELEAKNVVLKGNLEKNNNELKELNEELSNLNNELSEAELSAMKDAAKVEFESLERIIQERAVRDPENTDCPICMMPIYSYQPAAKCDGAGGKNHYFHYGCIKDFFERQTLHGLAKVCPICKGSFKLKYRNVTTNASQQQSLGRRIDSAVQSLANRPPQASMRAPRPSRQQPPRATPSTRTSNIPTSANETQDINLELQSRQDAVNNRIEQSLPPDIDSYDENFQILGNARGLSIQAFDITDQPAYSHAVEGRDFQNCPWRNGMSAPFKPYTVLNNYRDHTTKIIGMGFDEGVTTRQMKFKSWNSVGDKAMLTWWTTIEFPSSSSPNRPGYLPPSTVPFALIGRMNYDTRRLREERTLNLLNPILVPAFMYNGELVNNRRRSGFSMRHYKDFVQMMLELEDPGIDAFQEDVYPFLEDEVPENELSQFYRGEREIETAEVGEIKTVEEFITDLERNPLIQQTPNRINPLQELKQTTFYRHHKNEYLYCFLENYNMIFSQRSHAYIGSLDSQNFQEFFINLQEIISLETDEQYRAESIFPVMTPSSYRGGKKKSRKAKKSKKSKTKKAKKNRKTRKYKKK